MVGIISWRKPDFYVAQLQLTFFICTFVLFIRCSIYIVGVKSAGKVITADISHIFDLKHCNFSLSKIQSQY